MKKVKIVTDSAADLPQEILLSRNIRVVPLYVTLVNQTLRDGVELPANELYTTMRDEKAVPRTSQPSPEDFFTAFTDSLGEGEELLCITLSSNLSGTNSSAHLAKELVPSNERIHIHDSLNASLGEGLKALIASDLAEEGKSATEIIDYLRKLKLRTSFTVDHLQYLERGGRIGKAQAAVATVLDIKPILTMSEEGRIEGETKVRGRQKAIRYLLDRAEEDLSPGYDGYMGLSHAFCPDEASKIIATLTERFPQAKIITGQIGAVIGSHVGPGCLALFYELK